MKKAKEKNTVEKLRSSNHGITLIALVITIIVLLILAGISITMLSGNNSILSRADEASKGTIHANVYEHLQLKSAEYYIGKNTGEVTEGTLIEYLQSGSKPIISAELGEEGSGKYQILVENLLGTTQKYGKGTASGSDESTYQDVYILEKVETSTGSIENLKVASTTPIKLAVNNQATNYLLKYYGTGTGSSNVKILGNIGDTAGVSLSDIDKLKAYFNGNTYDDLHEYVQHDGDEFEVWKNNTQIGIIGADLSIIVGIEEFSEDEEYMYNYIKYKTKIYKVKGNNSEPYAYTDDIVEVPLTGTKGLCQLDGKNVFVTEDGEIVFYYDEVEDSEFGTIYKIDLNFIGYYESDGTIVGIGDLGYEEGHSNNITTDGLISEIYRLVEDEELEYTSKDTNIATVDNEGNVTGITEGNTKITVRGKTSGKTIDVFVYINQGVT